MNPPGESIVGKLPAGALAGFDLPSTLCSDLNLTPEEIARRTARQNDPRYLLQAEVILTSFSKDSEGKMRDKEATDLAEELRVNKHTKQLWLSDNRISERGAEALSSALEYNQTLVLLSLRGNLDMGDAGASAIVKSLLSNNTLKNLFLSRMRLGNETAYALAVTLRKNTTLEELSLTDNQISDDGVIALARGLEPNRTLRQLYLEHNTFGPVGTTALAEMLEVNNTLQELFLAANRIGDTGAQRLASALKNNWGLLKLDIERSTIPANAVDDVVGAFANALYKNNSLESLSLGLDFSAAAAKSLQAAVEVNTTILDISCPALTASGQLKDLFRRNRARMKEQRSKLYRALIVLGNNRERIDRCRLAALPIDLICHIATFADPFHGKPVSHLSIRALNAQDIFRNLAAIRERLRRKMEAPPVTRTPHPHPHEPVPGMGWFPNSRRITQQPRHHDNPNANNNNNNTNNKPDESSNNGLASSGGS